MVWNKKLGDEVGKQSKTSLGGKTPRKFESKKKKYLKTPFRRPNNQPVESQRMNRENGGKEMIKKLTFQMLDTHFLTAVAGYIPTQ